jgi:hypothetical protein
MVMAAVDGRCVLVVAARDESERSKHTHKWKGARASTQTKVV